MKLFTKLALVSAVAVSGSAMAMESMDDSALSSTTGQEGITVGLAMDHITIGSLYIHDNDGLAVGTAAVVADPTANPPVLAKPASPTYGLGGTGKAGAITITGTGYNGSLAAGASQKEQDAHALKLRTVTNGIDIKANPGTGFKNIVLLNGTTPVLAQLDIDSDAGTAADGGAFLNIAAKVSGLDIAIGKIGVAKSNAKQTSGAVRGIETGTNNVILSGLNLKTGQTSANIQLGATPQKTMINITGVMTDGLTIEDLGIVDNAGKGQITLGSLHIADNGGTDLSTNAKVSVVPAGLEITALASATDMYIGGVSLSGSKNVAANTWTAGPSIGDIEVRNMAISHNGVAGAIIYVSGH